MTRYRYKTVLAAIGLLLLLSLCLPGISVAAPEVDLRGIGPAQGQTRQLAAIDRNTVLRACLTALQDLRFSVADSDLDSGLLAAQGPYQSAGARHEHSLSIVVTPIVGTPGQFLVRTTLSHSGPSLQAKHQRDWAARSQRFYQQFFQHLLATLHREATPS